MRKLAIVGATALLCAALAVVAAAAPSHGLEKSYGKDGVAAVTLPGDRDASVRVSDFAAAGDGSAYVVADRGDCVTRKCLERQYLVRFAPSGHRVASFGGDGAAVVPSRSEYVTVVADGAARAVVGEVEKHRIVIYRFDHRGRLDRHFGHAGTVVIPCACSEADLELVRMPRGRLLAVASHETFTKNFKPIDLKLALTELRADGGRVRGFGRSGSADLTLDVGEVPEQVERTAGGAILLGGAEGDGGGLWVERLRPDGTPDRRFDRNAASAVARLGTFGLLPHLAGLLPRSDGTVDVVGTGTGHHGYYLRLRRDGRLDASFGARGVLRLPLNIESAVAGLRGAVFAVGEVKGHYDYRAFRILPSGRFDPRYGGAKGLRVPLYGEYVDAESQGGGKVLVTDGGYFECREGCPPEPAMVRFRE